MTLPKGCIIQSGVTAGGCKADACNYPFCEESAVAAKKKITASELGLPPKGTDLNTWIEQMVSRAKKMFTSKDIGTRRMIYPEDAADIARAAALFVIADKDTLIGNLRNAGYTVIEPDSPAAEALHDIQTHGAAWQTAFIQCRDAAGPPGDDDADRSYWQHEMLAHLRVTQALKNTVPAKAAPAADVDLLPLPASLDVPAPQAAKDALARGDALFAAFKATHRHVKRGTTYELLGMGKLQCGAKGLGEIRMMFDKDDVAIYRGQDGSLWARRASEMEDGRFEKL